MIKCSSDNLFQPNKLLIEFLHAQNPGLYEFIPGLNIIHFSLKRPGYVDMILILLRRSPYQWQSLHTYTRSNVLIVYTCLTKLIIFLTCSRSIYHILSCIFWIQSHCQQVERVKHFLENMIQLVCKLLQEQISMEGLHLNFVPCFFLQLAVSALMNLTHYLIWLFAALYLLYCWLR